MQNHAAGSPIDRIAGNCVAVRTRILSRRVTRIYDDALRSHGIRVSQLNVLVAVGAMGTATPRQIQEALAMGQSTVSRALDRLLHSGWIELVDEKDARLKPASLTAAGLQLIERVAPDWDRAQERIRRLLGRDGVESLHELARVAVLETH